MSWPCLKILIELDTGNLNYWNETWIIGLFLQIEETLPQNGIIVKSRKSKLACFWWTLNRCISVRGTTTEQKSVKSQKSKLACLSWPLTRCMNVKNYLLQENYVIKWKSEKLAKGNNSRRENVLNSKIKLSLPFIVHALV